MTPPTKQAAFAAGLEQPDATTRAQRLRLATSDEHKKSWGQYFTPPDLAAFMATLPRAEPSRCVRILDPGAGTGALGIALARALLDSQAAKHVELYCVEHEPQARHELELALSATATRYGRRLITTIFPDDFLDFATPRLGGPTIPPIDIAIANPPYFKMSPKDPRGGDAPNIYARFMEVTGKMLRDGGQLCFVVPRSYASGPYFRRFRRRFHHTMQLQHVHVFESRSAAFKTDKVLQENIVVLYEKHPPAPAGHVTISVSTGIDDLAQRQSFTSPRHELVSTDDNAVLSLPTDRGRVELMRRIQGLPNTLETLGLQISTGPVVPFRAEAYLVEADYEGPTVPLLWLQHVRKGQVIWPLGDGFRKHEHIRPCAGLKLMVPTANYVLLRRFSAKEEHRRLTAAPLLGKDWSAPQLGLENHLNYIHRPGAALSTDEALGLSALLNSQILDEFFRVASSNTQVSATEIRALPLPSLPFIEQLGRASRQKSSDDAHIESLILEMLDESGR